jgi:hypothetical protein
MKFTSFPVSVLLILGMIFPGWNVLPPALGQSSPTGNFSFPGATPSAMNLQNIFTSVQSAMQVCQQKNQMSRATSLLDKADPVNTIAGLANRKTRGDAGLNLLAGTAGVKPKGNCYDAVLTGKSGEKSIDQTKLSNLLKSRANCLMDCEPPEAEGSGCVDFFGPPQKSGKYNGKQLDEGGKRILEAVQKINIYKAVQNFKTNTCTSQDETDLKLAQELYQCQQKALSDAVSAAALQLQNTLNEHKTAFDRMSQANQELFQQWKDINVILGAQDESDPDPLFKDDNSKSRSNQFGGLIGLQRALNEDLAQQETEGAQFKQEVDALKVAIQTNNEKLERGRMENVSSCMSQTNSIGVSGGRALTCFSNKDAGGKDLGKYVKRTCGPLEFLQTQVEQSAYKTGTGNVVQSQERRDNADRLGLEFKNVADSILNDMRPRGGEQEVLSPDATTWSEISSKYGPALSELSNKTGVNLMGQLEKVASFCFSGGDRWKNQQVRSASSAYGKEKAAYEKTRSELNGKLQKGLGKLKKNYSDAMAVLGNQAVALNTFNCTKTDPQKMLDCYGQIRSHTRDLLEGTGTSATVIRNDKGQPIAPPCKGINGCVTVLNQARKVKKGHVQEGRKIQTAFSIQARAKIDQDVLGLANMLKGLQQQVSAQYGVVSGLANKLGVKANASPKMVDGPEALQPVEESKGPPPSGPGPYKSPGDMAKVLSGKMMPGGMINFADDGMGEFVAEAMDKIKEKKEKAKEDLDKFKDRSKEIQELAQSCRGDKDGVGNACDAAFCRRITKCSGNDAQIKEIANLATLFQDATGVTESDKAYGTSLQTAMDNLEGVDCSSEDDLIKEVCFNCISTKSEKFSSDVRDIRSANEAK